MLGFIVKFPVLSGPLKPIQRSQKTVHVFGLRHCLRHCVLVVGSLDYVGNVFLLFGER